ncbi:multicopper oxidase domain-containing protein [Candidatus Nitrosocosmicus hydrocola]|uniref:multicopper oxidase domain-containing protein n=1 Tax=Candidatus Nitrosocosmicus hydrocola TaxID=1826872 RepID=UPI000A7D97C2|nr:multicopper oxidase domain-containing protein [Candidatus Nitrosocosmicus hydrocola]
MFRIVTGISFPGLVYSFSLVGFAILLINSGSTTTESYGIGLSDDLSINDDINTPYINVANLSIRDNPLALDLYDKSSNFSIAKDGDLDNKFQPNKIYTLVAEHVGIEISPNNRVLAWTFNGTMPGPTIRMSEGENITVKFMNRSPIPHTIHFHGHHDELNDGIGPMVMPGQTYLYNITGGPAGVLLYYCHVAPTSQHIKMGMYGALIIDPKNKTALTPAKEVVLVMSEFNIKDPLAFLADYYLINGYTDQYLHYPIKANQNEVVRFYIVNAGVNLPYSFHLHGTLFEAYPSGLFINSPIESQSVLVGPGDASIVEAKWKYPGTYLFHGHGLQQERGSKGMIEISPIDLNGSTTYQKPLNQSVSLFNDLYDLQTELQSSNKSFKTEIDTDGNKHQQYSFDIENILKRNPINPIVNVSIPLNAGLPNNDNFYSPSTIKVQKGQEVRWVNHDKLIHTVTSGDPSTGSNGLFDSGIMVNDDIFTTVFVDEGVFIYYCIYHPWMFGEVIVED